jgi:hypothetical protein
MSDRFAAHRPPTVRNLSARTRCFTIGAAAVIPARRRARRHPPGRASGWRATQNHGGRRIPSGARHWTGSRKHERYWIKTSDLFCVGEVQSANSLCTLGKRPDAR